MGDTVEEFLQRIADASPAPGGGSASALAGALGAALAEMVTGLALGKEGYEAVQADVRDLTLRAQALRRRLLELVTLDADAYESVALCFKMPKRTDEEKAKRKAAIQHALREAALVPLETMERSLEALEITLAAVEKGNRSAFTDAGVAALLAQAALRGAALNVQVNLQSLADQAFRGEMEAKVKSLIERGAELARRVDDAVQKRLGE